MMFEAYKTTTKKRGEKRQKPSKYHNLSELLIYSGCLNPATIIIPMFFFRIPFEICFFTFFNQTSHFLTSFVRFNYFLPSGHRIVCSLPKSNPLISMEKIMINTFVCRRFVQRNSAIVCCLLHNSDQWMIIASFQFRMLFSNDVRFLMFIYNFCSLLLCPISFFFFGCVRTFRPIVLSAYSTTIVSARADYYYGWVEEIAAH